MVRLIQGVDQNGYPIVAGIPQSDTINGMHFTVAAAKNDTVPAGANFVVFAVSQSVDIYVKVGGSAAVLTGDVTDGSASELNPLVRQVAAGATIGVAVGAACDVTLAYYS